MNNTPLLLAVLACIAGIVIALWIIVMVNFALYFISDQSSAIYVSASASGETPVPEILFSPPVSENTKPLDTETTAPPEDDSIINASYSAADAELLARILYAECRGEPREGQLMVAQCVLNRIENGHWGNTVSSVVYAPGQFAQPGRLTKNLLAVAEAAFAGERFDEGLAILYFRRSANTGYWNAPYLGRVGRHAYYGYRNN